MTTRILVPLADGFEEMEAVTIIDVLRRGGLDVTTASVGHLAVKGAHDIVVTADTTLDLALSSDPFDAVVLPGGQAASTLRDDERVRSCLVDVVERGGTAAAICAAPIALQAAGLLAGRKATVYPGFGDQIPDAQLSDAAVVEDGPIVTGAGPGTAVPFALALVARLASRELADQVGKGMLVTS